MYSERRVDDGRKLGGGRRFAAALALGAIGILTSGLGVPRAPGAQAAWAGQTGRASPVRSPDAGPRAGGGGPAAPFAPLAAFSSASSALAARAARVVDLQETGHLHAIGEPGAVVDERGYATGTYACSIAVQLTIVSANDVTAAFTVKPHDGSVAGRGSARLEQRGPDEYFGGTIAITGGSGGFAHASGANIGVSGVIDRETLVLIVHVHGPIELR